MIAQTGVPLFLGGTSLLIVVNVTVDTISQIQSHLLAHQYGDLIKKAEVEGTPALRHSAGEGDFTQWISSSWDLRAPVRGRRPSVSKSTTACASFRPATCCAKRCKADTELGIKVADIMDSGGLGVRRDRQWP